MPDISAKDVAALRKLTGAGMMDCKKALAETGGDMDAAKEAKAAEAAAASEGESADEAAPDASPEASEAAPVESAGA